MLHHRASVVILKVLAQFTGRFWLVFDQVEYLSPSPVRERFKDQILIEGRRAEFMKSLQHRRAMIGTVIDDMEKDLPARAGTRR